MGSWGDVNVALNRLVREGVITGFRTNLAQPDRSSGLHVVAGAAVAGVGETFDDAVEAVRERVALELARVTEEATVTIEPALKPAT